LVLVGSWGGRLMANSAGSAHAVVEGDCHSDSVQTL
jgi:hypothetical protein